MNRTPPQGGVTPYDVLNNRASALPQTIIDNNIVINPVIGSNMSISIASAETNVNVYQRTANLFNKNACIAGKYINSSGVETAGTGWCASDWIPVLPDRILTNWGASATGSSAYHAFYDKDKVFISAVVSKVASVTQMVPATAAFVRFSVKTIDIDAYMVELNSISSAYVPYNTVIYAVPISGGVGNLNIQARANEEILTCADFMTVTYNKDMSTAYDSLSSATDSTRKYIHLSVDDTTALFADITANALTYTSIFDNAKLAYFRSLHNMFGAKISCYCYTLSGEFSLTTCTTAFAEEFLANSDWLRFGFHSAVDGTGYGVATAEKATTDYTAFITAMLPVLGGWEAIDRIPRLHNFDGTEVACVAMRDCDCGVLGFLTADDTRESYYLGATLSAWLKKHDSYYDATNRLLFIDTDYRLDSGGADVYAVLAARYVDPAYASCMKHLEIFTHESNVYGIPNLFKACKFARDYGYTFEFPQDGNW